MNTDRHALLELRLRGLLTPHCEVLRDGVELTRTGTLYSPLHTDFVIDGRNWQARGHIPDGRGIDLLRELVAGVLGRRAFALQDEAGTRVASARETGLFAGGYTLDVGGETGRLSPVGKGQQLRFEYHGPGGSGVCQHFAVQRLVRASLPASLTAEVQLFITLLALRHWVGFVHVGG